MISVIVNMSGEGVQVGDRRICWRDCLTLSAYYFSPAVVLNCRMEHTSVERISFARPNIYETLTNPSMYRPCRSLLNPSTVSPESRPFKTAMRYNVSPNIRGGGV